MNPSEIIDKMYEHDPFSLWLGIERVEEGAGFCTLKMKVRKEMSNGFSIAHGGICYSLADSALAFASNAHGKQAMSIETSISHLKPVKVGDELMAEAKEINLTRRTGIYDIRISNQRGELVAAFKGTVYRTEKTWQP